MEPLDTENITTVTEFIILGLSENPGLQVPLFLVFLLIYLITLLGNLVIITLIWADPHLHTPMYFFLCNLSLTDICYTSVIIPKLLGIFLLRFNTISYAGCLTQLYFFMSSAGVEIFLLTAMAYDRYVAICNPLRYSLIMNWRVCILMAITSWITAFLNSTPATASISSLSFCGFDIDHFFCDLFPLLKLSCTDTARIHILIIIETVVASVLPFLLMIISYVYIISAILKIRSAGGRRKAFSTCSSHLTVVSVFYLSIFCVYLTPKSAFSLALGKVFSVFYTAAAPMLNPIIYSARNREMQNALRKLVGEVASRRRQGINHPKLHQ
ncbi:olfactory receptor 1L4-like [Microcaecilia unicolor]|uniref:Olfactory receptor n=1 Tax=Microcaecilia unicolor TaxID=1415580 RepID=A0A6P7WNJ1_9AMPH|nr:olfactory receptor 1L4-like [Microcaecilia unicolor]